jgi:hypothetical protein
MQRPKRSGAKLLLGLDVVWQVVHNDLPDLERNLEPLIPAEDEL